MILIVPAWLLQHWLSAFLHVLEDKPITLLLLLDLISQEHGRLLRLNRESLHLTAWKLVERGRAKLLIPCPDGPHK